MELKPRKDRYNPDNVYHIYIKMERHPGVKWVSFKDKQAGEVTKGLFIPDVETGCIKVRNGNMFLSFKAIPVKGCTNTHVIIPNVSKGVDCNMGKCGKKEVDFRKATIGNMYVMGEILNEDQKKIIEKYVRRRKLLKIGRYKKG